MRGTLFPGLTLSPVCMKPLIKLRKVGIKGDLMDWFKDNLTDRKQRVVIRGQCSSWGKLMAGIPQGSVLSPLLFLIYINDLASVVKCNLKMFADDTCLYVTVDDPTSSATILNDNLSNIKHWANQCLVKFNPDKTKSMVLTNKNVVHPPLYFYKQTYRTYRTSAPAQTPRITF